MYPNNGQPFINIPSEIPSQDTSGQNPTSYVNFPNQGQPQNPQQSGFGESVFNMDTGNPLMTGLANQAFSQFGSQFIGKGSSIVNKQYTQSFSLLKYYFTVNNSYVVNKIKLLLFPLRHVHWKRRIHRTSEGEVFLPPRDDINAPDLYIPTMALVTYVLIIGYLMGASYKFTPEVLGTTATRALFALGLEVFLVKFGFYLLNSLTVSILDVVAYCGYKFVGIVLTILGGIIGGTYAFYGLLVVTSVFTAIFMVNTLKLVFPELTGYAEAGTTRRKYFLLGVGLLQLFFGYYLSYDIHLN